MCMRRNLRSLSNNVAMASCLYVQLFHNSGVKPLAHSGNSAASSNFTTPQNREQSTSRASDPVKLPPST